MPYRIQSDAVGPILGLSRPHLPPNHLFATVQDTSYLALVSATNHGPYGKYVDAFLGNLLSLVDGTVMPTWADVSAALSSKTRLEFSSIVPTDMLKPEAQQQIFWVDGDALDKGWQGNDSRVEIETCYCSIFEECWVTTRLKPTPRSINSCLEKPNGHLQPSPHKPVY